MWIARDKDGTLSLYRDKPVRAGIEPYRWWGDEVDGFDLDSSLFPNLTWEDEPIEVDLTIIEPFHFKLSDESKSIIEKNTGYSIDEIRKKNIFKNS